MKSSGLRGHHYTYGECWFPLSSDALHYVGRHCKAWYDQKDLDACLADSNITINDVYGFNPKPHIETMLWEQCQSMENGTDTCNSLWGVGPDYRPVRKQMRMRFDLPDLTWPDAVTSRSFPGIIHQTWFGPIDKLGLTKRALMQGCREMHEAAGWTYQLWDDESIRKLYADQGFYRLINQDWYNKAEQYKNLLSDIARFEILYHYGGVYLDSDSECLKPFDPQHEDLGNHECYADIEADWKDQYKEFPKGLVASGTIGCIPRSRTMMAMIIGLIYTDRSLTPWVSAGPYHFTKTFTNYSLPIKQLPYYIFYPTHLDHKHGLTNDTHRQTLIEGGSYATHHWGTTTSSYGERRI